MNPITAGIPPTEKHTHESLRKFKERPILFSSPMVRAILAGQKTQTRRIVKPQPVMTTFTDRLQLWASADREIACPYDAPGGLLWVREEHYRYGHWEEIPGVKTKTGRMKWKFVPDSAEVLYEPPASFRKGRHHIDPRTVAWHKRLARFRPRWVCRIRLEITDVRVERVREISEEDAIAEGMREPSLRDLGGELAQAAWSERQVFSRLWKKINGPDSWDANPLVWVISFKLAKTEAE